MCNAERRITERIARGSLPLHMVCWWLVESDQPPGPRPYYGNVKWNGVDATSKTMLAPVFVPPAWTHSCKHSCLQSLQLEMYTLFDLINPSAGDLDKANNVV